MKKMLYFLKVIICLVFFTISGLSFPKIKPSPTATSPASTQIRSEINSIIEELKKKLQNAIILSSEGQKLANRSNDDSPVAKDKLNQALVLYRSIISTTTEKKFLTQVKNSGELAGNTVVSLKNLEFSSKSLMFLTFISVAQAHANLGEKEKSIDSLKQSVTSFQELASDNSFLNVSSINYKEEIISLKFLYASKLSQIGLDLDNYFGKSEEGVNYLLQSLESFQSLYKETQNPDNKFQEAETAFLIGTIYGRQAKSIDKALEFFTKSLKIYQSLPNKSKNSAATLLQIALHQYVNFEFKNALENFDKALIIYRNINDKRGQARVLLQIASIYSTLNNKLKMTGYLNQTLSILQSVDFNENQKKDNKEIGIHNKLDDLLIELDRLSNIAYSYRLLEDYQKSLEYFEDSLKVAQSMRNPRSIRTSLDAIAFSFAKLKKWDKAAEFYKQALEISRSSGVKEDYADDLKDVGWALLEAGKPFEAIKYQNEALLTYQTIEISENEKFSPGYSYLLTEISHSQYDLGNKRLAIFFGKRAINVMQGERQRLRNLDVGSQKGFLEKKEKYYRLLAGWLIEEGRIIEAEQILAMLKDEEVAAYLRRDATEIDKLQKRTDLNDSEKAALARYNQIADKITAVGAEYNKLREKLQELQKQGLTPPTEQQKRYDELVEQVKTANNIFQAFLKQLADEFAKRGDTKKDLSENLALQSDLKELGEGVIFLYTLVGEDRYRVILTSPTIKTDGKYEIKAADLDKKISDFRQIVQNPKLDPKPLGKELYDILIKPIEKDLDVAKAKILLWSLDGNLRLLPIAALWDGKQYFGQKYQNVTITLASRSRLKESVSTEWRVLGLGVSEAKTVVVKDAAGAMRNIPFAALPAVTRELASIVSDEKNKTGVLPGQTLLNADFTEEKLKRQLLGGFKVIHIASHFDLNAGDSTESFLLLGDGGALTLREIKTNPELDFGGVELLTLSACQTAVVEKDSNGREIEGFGYIAQQKGAKAILATLWSVTDVSTQLLMTEFYRLRKENPQLTKAEAMQIAQSEMIEGKLQSATEGNKKGAEIAVTSEKIVGAPLFVIDKSKPFAHPYYWSPFILIGNWR